MSLSRRSKSRSRIVTLLIPCTVTNGALGPWHKPAWLLAIGRAMISMARYPTPASQH